MLGFFVLFYNATHVIFVPLCRHHGRNASALPWHITELILENMAPESVKERLFHAGIMAIQQKSDLHVTNQLYSGLL